MVVTLAEPPALPRTRPLMEQFVIDGGTPLSGTVIPAGNKNAALPILAASALTADEVVVRNVPRIRDVEAMLSILRGLGVRVEWRSDHEVALCAADLPAPREIDRRQAELIRASVLLAGPLLARFGQADMPPPGGDVIGRRRLDPHLDAFACLGAQIDQTGRDIVLTGRLRAGDVFMDEPSVMDTENALMAAALTPGSTIIGNAACEPHVQDLARMLVKMGADIQGIGSNVLTVHGRAELHGCTHEIAPDHIEIGSFMALAGVTGGGMFGKRNGPHLLEVTHAGFDPPAPALQSRLDQGHRPRRPADDPLGLRPPRPALRARRQRRARARRPAADRRARRRRVHRQGPGRPVARVPRGPDVDRHRAGHPVGGSGAHPRVD